MPMIRSEYYSTDSNVDPFLKTGLFTAIQTFASKAFHDVAEEMRLKKYLLLIRNLHHPDSDQQVMLYLVAERENIEISELRRRMKNLEKKIDLSDIVIDNITPSKELLEIRKVIDEELRDLALRPSDRARSVFG
ncbi:MAG: hypothetical protein GF308_01660 [Candidatus Heimdallarchaeota archaeon]|nr:hypothetical protein [Candidatus Heimdallarchaeota archaeon]